jgi:hypothetical protein
MRKIGRHAPEPHHAEIGKRFRRVAQKINRAKVDHAFIVLRDAYEGLEHPAKLARHEELLSRVETMEALGHQARGQGGHIVRSALDLHRQLTIDAERDHFRAQLSSQASVDGLSPDDVDHIVGPQMSQDELGTRVASSLYAFLERLRESVPPEYKPIHTLARRFRDVVLSEFARLQIADVCERCGRVFALTRPQKRFCSIGFEKRDCGARARSQRSYKKHTQATMSRSESARTAARARWQHRYLDSKTP